MENNRSAPEWSEGHSIQDTYSWENARRKPFAQFRVCNDEKNGKGLKSIAIYDSDCKKIAEIHTADHHGSGPHYHKWSNGRPTGDAIPIGKSPKYQKLLIETLNLL